MSNSAELSLHRLTKEAFDVKGKKIHFVGAGGVGMCSLVRLSRHLGALVTGSDRELNENLSALAVEGVRVFVGHKKEYVKGAELVVRSFAVNDDVPEIVYARENRIPCITRAEFLGFLNLLYKDRIAVAGTHGKSTTVAMLEHIFSNADIKPTVLSGAKLGCGTPTLIGDRSLMLYEACEYRDAFLYTHPTVSVITNVEMDHPDYFKNIDEVKSSFVKFANSAADITVLNADDYETDSMRSRISTRTVTFGCHDTADYRYTVTGFKRGAYHFEMHNRGYNIGEFVLSIPGVFNVSNAACAIAVACEYGVETEIIRASIASFRGIPRRLEFIGRYKGVPVIYDYAHHPTEIAKTLTAIRELGFTSVTAVFKPHTYSRTKALWWELVTSLCLADRIILTDIYPAREMPIPEITSQRLAASIGEGAVYSSDGDVVEHLSNQDGVIVLLGAGDMNSIIKEMKLDK